MKKKFIALLAAISAMSALIVMLSFAGCEDRNVFNGQIGYDVYADAELYKIGNFTYNSGEITSVEIDWVNQKVSVTEASGDTLSVSETDAGLSDEEKMRYLIKDGKLTIRYWKSGHIGIPPANTKQLTVEVPKNVELTVSAVSAFIDVEGVNTEDCKLLTVSGAITAKDCYVNRFNVNSASGKVDLDVPNVDQLKVGVTSGNVCINAKTAKEIDVEATSGSVEVDVDTSDSVSVETSSGKVSVTAKTAKKIDVEATSGNVEVDTDTSDSVSVETSSGKVNVSAKTAKEIDIEATSGKVEVDTFSSDDISVKTSSGSVYLTLNGQKLKSCKFDTTSGSSNAGKLVVGDGSLTVTVKTASGKLNVKN